MSHTELKVSGMTCGGCVKSVQNALKARDGVSNAVADLTSGLVTVDFDAAAITVSELQQTIEEAGFEVSA